MYHMEDTRSLNLILKEEKVKEWVLHIIAFRIHQPRDR